MPTTVLLILLLWGMECEVATAASQALDSTTTKRTIATTTSPPKASTITAAAWDYEKEPFPPPGIPLKTVNDYQIVRRLGTGKFSDVFEAVDVHANANGNHANLVVLKCLKPVSERKVRREVTILHKAARLPSLTRLVAVVVPSNSGDASLSTLTRVPGMPTLVLEHAGPKAVWLCHPASRGVLSASSRDDKKKDGADADAAAYLTLYEIQYAVCHLLFALDSLHEAGLMHRDVKPRNVLIHRLPRMHGSDHSDPSHNHSRPLTLIDLGLADIYSAGQPYHVRVASRHYKGPELLLGYNYYGPSLDIWGVGCILAGLLLRKEPLFRGKDNLDQLAQILQQLGVQAAEAFVKKHGLVLDEETQQVLQNCPVRQARSSWKHFLHAADVDASYQPDPLGLDLLDHLLKVDPDERWTCKQAIQHAFFDAVRSRVQAEVVQDLSRISSS